MMPFFGRLFGNAGSAHARGLINKAALEEARDRVAECLGVASSTIFFTSGATESLNWAIKKGAECQRKRGCGSRIIATRIEHPAVLEICRYLQELEQPYSVAFCPVDGMGVLDLAAFEKLVRENEAELALVTVPHANGEIGAVQPIREVTSVLRAHAPRALLHVDCSQALGKIPVHIPTLGADLVTIAGHKIYAPKGIGALYVGERVELSPLIHGGGQERGLRGGTENVPYCVALGKACEVISRAWEAFEHHGPRPPLPPPLSSPSAVPCIADGPSLASPRYEADSGFVSEAPKTPSSMSFGPSCPPSPSSLAYVAAKSASASHPRRTHESFPNQDFTSSPAFHAGAVWSPLTPGGQVIPTGTGAQDALRVSSSCPPPDRARDFGGSASCPLSPAFPGHPDKNGGSMGKIQIKRELDLSAPPPSPSIMTPTSVETTARTPGSTEPACLAGPENTDAASAFDLDQRTGKLASSAVAGSPVNGLGLAMPSPLTSLIVFQEDDGDNAVSEPVGREVKTPEAIGGDAKFEIRTTPSSSPPSPSGMIPPVANMLRPLTTSAATDRIVSFTYDPTDMSGRTEKAADMAIPSLGQTAKCLAPADERSSLDRVSQELTASSAVSPLGDLQEAGNAVSEVRGSGRAISEGLVPSMRQELSSVMVASPSSQGGSSLLETATRWAGSFFQTTPVLSPVGSQTAPAETSITAQEGETARGLGLLENYRVCAGVQFKFLGSWWPSRCGGRETAESLGAREVGATEEKRHSPSQKAYAISAHPQMMQRSLLRFIYKFLKNLARLTGWEMHELFAFIRINGPLRQVNVFQPVSATSTLPPFGRALPNTLLLSIRNTVGGDVVKDLRDQVCLSAGCTCHGSGGKISDTLQSVRLDPEWAKGTIRVSTGRFTTLEAATEAAGVLAHYLFYKKIVPCKPVDPSLTSGGLVPSRYDDDSD